jgi:hypothetical protein
MTPWDCESWSLNTALPVVSPGTGEAPRWHSGACRGALIGGAGAGDWENPTVTLTHTAPAPAINPNKRMTVSHLNLKRRTFERALGSGNNAIDWRLVGSIE